MKIGFFGDVHLPVFKKALQYKVLDWALSDIQSKADCAIFVGDVTCDGNAETYFSFLEKIINKINDIIPKIEYKTNINSNISNSYL